jgi:hypothetical protein
VARAAAFGAVLSAAAAHAQNAASQGYVPGASTNPLPFDEFHWCQGGDRPGALCAVNGDCTGGGTCTTVWGQVTTALVPSFVVTRTEQRTVGTSAVAAFSTGAAPCWSVRVKNVGSTTLYVGWSGVTTSSGVQCDPGEWCAPMYPPTRDCNDVKIIGDAASGKAAVVTP